MKKSVISFLNFLYLPIIIIMMVLCCIPISIFAQEKREVTKQNNRDTLILEKHKTTYHFDAAIYYATTDLATTFNDFISQENNFSPFIVEGNKVFLPSDQASWFQIPVRSEYDEISDWFLQVSNGYQMQLYIPQLDGSYREKRFGIFYKDSLQSSVPNYYSTTFSLKKGTSMLYMRVVPSERAKKQGGYKQTFVLFRKDAAHNHFAINLATNSIIYTIILAMCLYNLILFFLIKDKSYLYYCISIFCMGIYFYTVPTLKSVAFWGKLTQDSEFNAVVNYISLFLTVIFWIKFTQSYFGMRTNFPKWNRYFTITIFINIILATLYIFLIGDISNIFVIILHLITTISLMTFSVVVFYRKELLGKQFFMANAILFVFAIIYMGDVLHIIPSNWFTDSALEIGIMIQIVLFSLALASRINLLRQQVSEQTIDKERLERIKAEEIKYVIEKKNQELEEKVKQRTAEISEKNTELEQVVEELDTTNETLRYTINRVEEQNTQITSSIAYAQRIQEAILPRQEEIKKFFPNSFIIFSPLHVVSGDFYWFLELGEKKFLGAFDCTGHGVPGAFMALIANELLNEIILYKKITSPEKILSQLHKSIQYSLKQSETKSEDSIDGTLLCVETDKENGCRVEIASARNSVYIFDTKGAREIKGDRMSIGGDFQKENVSFSLYSIQIEEQTDLYMLSDGLQDQFGEKTNKKFMKKRVRELLNEVTTYDSSLQKRTIESTLENWKGIKEQTDDILVMGLRLKGNND